MAYSRSRRGVVAGAVAVIIVIIIGTAAAVGATVYYSRNSNLLSANLLSPSNDGTSSELTSNASPPIATSLPSAAGQISVTAQDLVPTYLAGEGNSPTLTCATGFAPNSITLTNKGGADVAATSMSIAYSGETYTFAITSACALVSGGSVVIAMGSTDLLPGALSGQAYSGTVTLSDGEEIPFGGTLQSSQTGQAGQVAVTDQDLMGTTLAAGSNGASPACVSAFVGNSVTVVNDGSAAVTATLISVDFAGGVYSFPIEGVCSAPAGGRAIIAMAPSDLVTNAAPGEAYSGAVTLSDGEQILFAGTFLPSAGQMPQLVVTTQSLLASSLAGGSNSAGPVCATGIASNSITLANEGNTPLAATSVSITFAGVVYTFPIAGPCTVAGGASIVIAMAATDFVKGATPGQAYSGTVTLSNGELIPFAGTFQGFQVGQGAQVTVTGTNLVGATLAAGSNSATPTCATGSAANSILLVNAGDAPASATLISIDYGGAVYNFPITGACTVTADGVFGGNPLYITMSATDLVTGAVSGASFAGTVTMSNGVTLAFAGTFQ